MKEPQTKKILKDSPPSQPTTSTSTFGGQPVGSTTLGSMIGFPGSGKSEWDTRVDILKTEMETWHPIAKAGEKGIHTSLGQSGHSAMGMSVPSKFASKDLKQKGYGEAKQQAKEVLSQMKQMKPKLPS